MTTMIYPRRRTTTTLDLLGGERHRNRRKRHVYFSQYLRLKFRRLKVPILPSNYSLDPSTQSSYSPRTIRTSKLPILVIPAVEIINERNDSGPQKTLWLFLYKCGKMTGKFCGRLSEKMKFVARNAPEIRSSCLFFLCEKSMRI